VKRLFFGCILLLGAFYASSAQTQGFHKVYSPDGVEVWGVGNGGRVFKSFDGGVTWGQLTLGTSSLRSVAVRGSRAWVVGDDGIVFSTTGSVVWNADTVSAGRLYDVLFLGDSVGFLVGDSGLVRKTVNAGETWSNVSSPLTSQSLRAIVFRNSSSGWIVGTRGTLLRSTDGGDSWGEVNTLGTERDLRSVAVRGDTVIVVGADAFFAKSTNGGTTWSTQNLHIETKSDLNKVLIKETGLVTFCGGGGFIRTTSDLGTTYGYQKHPMLASLSDLYFFDEQTGWGCSERTNVVIHTTDGGLTWAMPSGTTVTYSWSQKLSAGGQTVRGNTFAINSFDKKTIYVVLGARVYISRDIGETWTQIATIPNGSKTNSFYVSPFDTNIFVAAFGSPDVITRSTNRGSTWTTTLARAFTEYGMPLEMDPNDPNTLYFGPEDSYLYKSTDFGATWDTLSRPMFRSPCDLVVVYEKPNVMYCGDGVTGSGNGQIFHSGDGGRTWDLIVTVTGSEIPTIGSSWLDNNLAFATAWSSGGVRRTMNQGLNWQQVMTTSSAWGVDVAKDDPTVAVYGVYSGSTSYVSTNGGDSWFTTNLVGSNYAFLAYDRSTLLAQQSGGIHKYLITYNVPVTNLQSVSILQPAQGSMWPYNSAQDITWASGNVTNVRIDLKQTPTSSWQTIVASVPASAGSYAWTVPYAPSSQARIRISDASDGSPSDSSGIFTIVAPAISLNPSAVDFDSVSVGASRSDTIRIYNVGTSTLVVSNVDVSDPAFAPSRTSFSIAPGESDTLSVSFVPTAPQMYVDTLRIAINTPDSVVHVPISGVGIVTLSVGEVGRGIPSRFSLDQNYPNPFNPSTTIFFDLPGESFVTLRVYNMLGQEVAVLTDREYAAGRYGVQFDGAWFPSGLYFYRIHATGTSSGRVFSETRRMILIK
jgi:photosystem II stability/assembly factor-like uncharacterized protein